MNLTATGMALLALLGAVIPVYHLFEHRAKPGAGWLLGLCVVLAIYPMDVLFLEGELAVRHRFATISLVAPLYLLAVVSYLRLKHRAWSALAPLLYVYMPLSAAAPWLLGSEYLSFPSEQPYAAFQQYQYSLEAGAWSMKIVSYFLIVLAAHMAMQRLNSSRYSNSYVLALALIPMLAGVADLVASLTNFTPYHGITSVQIATTLGLYTLSYALLRQRMLERVPVSRNLLMSHLQEGVCVVASDGEIVDCNEAFGAIVGVSPARMMGRSANHVLPEALLAELDTQHPAAGARNSSVHLDSTNRVVRVEVKALGEDEAGAARLLSVSDVTEQSNELASVAATADELLEENEQLAEMSVTDPLTGLGNRRRLQDALASRCCDEQAKCAGLVMVDIDHFKAINDTHGHAAGDAVLVRLAKAMRDVCRDKDLIVRWGGEEFVILLDETDERRLHMAAERLRLHIRRLVTELDNGVALQVTASIGATLVRPGQSSEVALKQVDELLYEAKKEGRDRVKAPHRTDPT